jgi:predicted dehydrogenase
MMTIKPFKIGVIGYGRIGKIHTAAYMAIPPYSQGDIQVELEGVCSSDEKECEQALKSAPFKWSTTDYRELLQNKEIDVVSICVPNHLHREMVIAALNHGKYVYAEKPLALNLSEAEAIMEVARKTNIPTGMAFQNRFIPAVIRAKEIIAAGSLGKIFHFRFAYYRSKFIDPALPAIWRLQSQFAGGGALVDLGAHLIDLILHLLGEFTIRTVHTDTFISQRSSASNPKEQVKVDVDDYALMQLRLKAGGAAGTLEVSRYATGSPNELSFEIYGSKGALRFNTTNPNYLQFFDNTDVTAPTGGNSGFKAIQTIQRYPECSFVDPVNEIGWIRYHIASLHYYLQALLEKKEHHPCLEDGYRVQQFIETAYAIAKKNEETGEKH